MTTARWHPATVGRAVLGCWAALVVGGCGTPDAANIVLRKQNQQLQDQLTQATGRADRAQTALAAAEQARPTLPTLPPDRLDQLFTTHDLQFGRLTGGDNPDSVIGPDTMLRVYVVPVDGDGTPLKAAGAFTVEAFDLGDPGNPLVGTWRFPLDASRKLFFDQLTLYTYVLPCPWQAIPPHPTLTVRVTFEDQLTGRRFVRQTQASVHPAPSTRRAAG